MDSIAPKLKVESFWSHFTSRDWKKWKKSQSREHQIILSLLPNVRGITLRNEIAVHPIFRPLNPPMIKLLLLCMQYPPMNNKKPKLTLIQLCYCWIEILKKMIPYKEIKLDGHRSTRVYHVQTVLSFMNFRNMIISRRKFSWTTSSKSLELGMPMDLSLFDWVVSIEKKKKRQNGLWIQSEFRLLIGTLFRIWNLIGSDLQCSRIFW